MTVSRRPVKSIPMTAMGDPRNQLYIWQGRVLYSTRENVTEPHGHYASSILLGINDAFKIVETEDPQVRSYRAAVLSPNVSHRLDGSGTRMIILQIDPDFTDFQPLQTALGERPVLGLDFEIFGHLLERFDALMAGELDCSGARDLYDDILTAITHQPARHAPMDDRVRRALRILKDEKPDAVSVPALASRVDLSPDRFMHLFKETMGLPVRKYLLWLKLQRAARAMKDGANLTHAAHDAGFSDSAHLSRTFKDMFGLPPSYLLANEREVRVHYCHEGA